MKNLALIIFFAALTGAVVWIYKDSFKAEAQVAKDKLTSDKPLVTEVELQEQLTALQMRRRKLADKIEYMERNRDETLQSLNAKGISKKADAKGDPEALMALQSLKGWMSGINEFRTHLEKVDASIPRIKAILEKMQRERLTETIGLTEDEQIDLRAIEMELDDRLGINENDIFGDQEIDELLEQANEENGVELELDNEENGSDFELEELLENSDEENGADLELKKTLEKIDEAVGVLDVKRQKVENKKNEISGQMGKVRRSLFRSQSSLNLVQSKIEKLQGAKDRIESQLRKLKRHISEAQATENKAVKINGRAYTGADLAKMAEQIIVRYQALKTQINGYETHIVSLGESITFLEQQDQASQEAIRELDLTLEVIKTKNESLDTIRKNIPLSGVSKSLRADIESLPEGAEAISIDVDFQVEPDRMAEITNQTEIVDEILQGGGGLDAAQDLLSGLLDEEADE